MNTPLKDPKHQPDFKPTPVGDFNVAGHMGPRPRHAAFSADGAKLFVLYEMASVLTMHCFDAATGDVGPALSALPSFPYDPQRPPAGAFHAAAEVAVHRSGRIFASTRGIGPPFKWVEGQSFVRAFTSGGTDGALTAIQDVAVLPNPRHFTFDKEQRWLIITANGGFTSHRMTDDGEIGTATESKLGGAIATMGIDCVVLVEKV